MRLCQIALWTIALLIVANGVISILPHFVTRRRAAASPRAALVIFAESIRWLNVRWGTRTVSAALARCGYLGEFLYWRWHAAWRGTLILPCIMARGLLEREARRLADFIIEQRRQCPQRPIYLVGYSCGGYIATRALELLPPGIRVEGVVLLAAALDPRRDLALAASAVGGNMVITSSPGDWLILGLGTLLFGTGDRRWRPSMGMIGPAGACPPNVRHLRWRLRDVATGHTGGHFGASAAGYFQARIAPHLFAPADTFDAAGR